MSMIIDGIWTLPKVLMIISLAIAFILLHKAVKKTDKEKREDNG